MTLPRASGGLLLAASALAAALFGGFCFISAPAVGSRHLRAGGRALAGAPVGAGAALDAEGFGAARVGCLLLAAGGAVAACRSAVARRAAKDKGPMMEQIPRPEDLLDSPKFPLFMGSTSGYMSRSTRERHAITWTSKVEQDFEMPTGGMAIMNKGENLCYFRKKEQCLALGKQLREKKIDNYKIYRLKKDGTVIFMHPADGVFPEKVNKGRVQVNGRPFSIGCNPQPGLLKYTKYHMKSYEADPLTTMFVKARLKAFADIENLFPLPNPVLPGDTWAEARPAPTAKSL